MAAPSYYSYRPDTGEFIGKQDADPSPKEPGKFLFPAHSTQTAPPAEQAKKVRCYIQDVWVYLADRRGEVWYLADGTPVMIESIGDPTKFDPPLRSKAPPPEPSKPVSISRRQFFQQLAINTVISEADALKAQAGVIPPAMDALIAAMPEDRQFSARMLVAGAANFNRTDPLVAEIGAAYKWTSAQIDKLWADAAKL
jgi:hypothetical protein